MGRDRERRGGLAGGQPEIVEPEKVRLSLQSRDGLSSPSGDTDSSSSNTSVALTFTTNLDSTMVLWVPKMRSLQSRSRRKMAQIQK